MTSDSNSPEKNSKETTYADAGVNIDAGNAVVDRIKPLAQSTARAGSNPDLGGFGGLFDLKAAGFVDPVLVAANDGVGTKLKIAIETGIHNTVGIDLVAMCVNDLIVQGAEPLFFLDYLATGKLKENEAEEIITGIAEGCRQAGCALIGGETAEMPGMYAKGDYDLAGFCVGAVERNSILPKKTIEEGDVIIGLPSTGVHSNGFSLVRKIISDKGLTFSDEAPFSSQQTLGQALLTPTQIYVKPVLETIEKFDGVKALAHITGGGLTENIPRVLPENKAAKIDLSAVKTPPVFGWLQQGANMSAKEMLRTFNCGVGMVLVANKTEAESICKLLESHYEGASIIGFITSRETESVVYENSISL